MYAFLNFFSYFVQKKSEYIFSKQPLGGLLLLLPQKIGNKIKDGNEGEYNGLFKNILVDLENLLIHANIPVSYNSLFYATINSLYLPFFV